MKRSDLDAAIVELDDYLTHAAGEEAVFQNWAERHLVAFYALGYRRAEPHPRLQRPDGELFVPDFLCETDNGIWEIVELKTAKPAIYKDKDRRPTFYQPMTECIAQCNDYSKWLSQAPAKQQFETKYDAKLSDRPGAMIIAGGATDYDRRVVAEDLGRRTPPMRLHSWKDVLELLLQFRARTFGDFNNARGCSVILTVRVDHQPNDALVPLVDIGRDESANRLLLCIKETEGLLLKVKLNDGSEQQVDIRASDGGFEFGKPLLLEIEVVSAPTFVRIGVDINRQEAAAIRLSRGSFELTEPFCMTVGSNMKGETGAALHMFGVSTNTKPVSPLYSAPIARQLAHQASQPDTMTLKFSPQAFMYSVGHPLFDPGTPPGVDLVQQSGDLSPTLARNPQFFQ
jgi:hypothetical protein